MRDCTLYRHSLSDTISWNFILCYYDLYSAVIIVSLFIIDKNRSDLKIQVHLRVLVLLKIQFYST